MQGDPKQIPARIKTPKQQTVWALNEKCNLDLRPSLLCFTQCSGFPSTSLDTQGWRTVTVVAAAGTQCAVVYACFHSNPVDTAEQEKLRQSQVQERGSGMSVDAAFHFKKDKMGVSEFIHQEILFTHLAALFKGLHTLKHYRTAL